MFTKRRLSEARDGLLGTEANGLRFVVNADPECPLNAGARVRGTSPSLRVFQAHVRSLGYIRQLEPRQKAEVRALRAERGVRAAIARARKLAGR